MKLNKIDEVWSSANPLFKWRFRFAVIDYFATMAMWRNDFSSPFKRTVLDWIPVPLSVELKAGLQILGPRLGFQISQANSSGDSGIRITSFCLTWGDLNNFTCNYLGIFFPKCSPCCRSVVIFIPVGCHNKAVSISTWFVTVIQEQDAHVVSQFSFLLNSK